MVSNPFRTLGSPDPVSFTVKLQHPGYSKPHIFLLGLDHSRWQDSELQEAFLIEFGKPRTRASYISKVAEHVPEVLT
jgi:hypothetical protein